MSLALDVKLGGFAKRTLAVSVAAVAAISLAACSSSGGSGSPSTTAGGVSGSSGSSPGTTSLPATISVPFFLAQTGAASIYTPAQLNGAKLGVDDVNAAGTLGSTKLVLAPVDTAGDPQKAVTAYTAQQSKKFYGALTVYTGQTVAMLPLAKQNNQVLYSAGAQDDSLIGNVPNLYSDVPPNEDELDALVSYLVKTKGAKSIGVVYTQDEQSGVDDIKASVTKYGAKLTGEESAAAGATDFRSQLTKLRQANPDVLIGLSYGASVKAIFDQTRELGWNVQLAANSGVATPSILSDTAANGLIYTSFAVYTDSFLSEYKAKFNSTPDNDGAGTAYDSILAYAAALKIVAAKGYSLDATGIGKAMAEVSVPSSLGGTLTFDSRGASKRPISILQNAGGTTTTLQPGKVTS